MSTSETFIMTDRVRSLVYGALAPSPPDDLAQRVAALNPEEWQAVLHLVRQHRVGPMLFWGLSRGGLLERVPHEVAATLQQQQRRWGMRNLKTHAELVRVCRLLEEAGIETIALKGAYLATFAYPSLGLRPLRDIDLLVHPDDGMKAFEILQGQGYVPEEHGDAQAYVTQIKHLPRLDHPHGVSVELHLRLTSPRGDFADRPWIVDDEATLWGRSVVRTVGGSDLRFLEPVDLLLHLALHATVDHRLSIGPLGMVDFAWLAHTHDLDWERVMARACTCGLEKQTLSVLGLAARRFGTPLPALVLGRLDGNEAWLESADHLIYADAEHLFVMKRAVMGLAQGSLGDRLRQLAALLFPERDALAAECRVRPGPWLALNYPSYWIKRLRKLFSRSGASVLRHRHSLKTVADHQSAFDDWLARGPKP
ncbi:MAG: hypothetical protein AUJ55_11115 [Proteobacteria bacterium CG1_02_64_396]|nr:MAG: hypothetical protein AUJ55_11115 [Proteobacteria bacterium CG1_02_64_396]